MASELKVNTLTGVSTAGSIAVTGEGNSTTTNLQQGLAKNWFIINATDGSLRDSFNIASASDNGTGSFTQTFTNAMNSGTYSFVAMAGHNDNTEPDASITVMHKTTTDGTRVRIHNASGSEVDEQDCCGLSMGDLA